jgi:putative ABC transport system permease protein
MGMLRLWLSRVKGALTRRSEDAQMDEEIAAHLEMLRERLMSRGAGAEEAERLARVQFGNVTTLKEQQRAMRGFLAPTEWWRDVRFAGRKLKKNWLSNLAIVAALALGIGMNTAVFSFMNALLLRPVAGVNRTSNLMEVWLHSRDASGPQSFVPFDYPDYFYYRAYSRSFDGLLAFDGDPAKAIWNHDGSGQAITGQLVSGNYFAGLGVGAAMGRTLSPGDDENTSSGREIVLSHSFWKAQFHSDAGMVGRTIVLNGAAFTVIGVAPAGFEGLLVGMEPDFWAPLATQAVFTHDAARASDHNGYWLIVAGHLKQGVSKTQAQAELKVLGRQVEQAHPEALNHMEPRVFPATLVPGPYRLYVGAATGLLLAVFVLVLVIACTNAASLLLARATGRTHEMAIRSALGAGRARLIRQLMVESLMLSLIAGAAALWIGWMVAGSLMRLVPASLPIRVDVPFDWRVLLFTVVLSVATGVLFGLAPALRGSAVKPAPALKENAQNAGVRRSRLRTVLLVGEVALCVVLLTGATLCVRSLLHANSIDPGFDTHRIAMATLDPSALGYSQEKTDMFYRELMQRVRGLPGVASASYADNLPLGPSFSQTSAGKSVGHDELGTYYYHVGPEFFRTVGIPMLAGRDFTQAEADGASTDGVVVNAYLAKRLWPGQNPIGQRFALGGEKTSREVIGVVKDGKYQSLGEAPAAAVYEGGLPAQRMIVVRSTGDDRPLLQELRQEVRAIDPQMVATNAETIEAYMAWPLFPARTAGILLGVSGVLALVLTTIGLFGVIAYVVSQRTHEIGVRIALGASRSDVLKLVLRQGLSVTMIGIGIGLCGALAGARLLSPVLYGLSADDPVTFAAVAIGLAAVAMTACYLPARRAMGIDPASALRYE